MGIFPKCRKDSGNLTGPDGAEKFQLQPAHSVSCNWNFSASSDRSDFRKPLHTFDNAVTPFAPISGISRIPRFQTAEHPTRRTWFQSAPILFLVIIYISFSYSMVSSTPADTSGKYVLLNR